MSGACVARLPQSTRSRQVGLSDRSLLDLAETRSGLDYPYAFVRTARENHVSLRTPDKTLWQYSREAAAA